MFATPVPLRTNTEYALRVMAPTSNGYEMWTSKLGEASVNYPGQIITSQQADGSLFTSQNGSTWTADQYSDLSAMLSFYNYDASGQSTAVKMRTDIGNGVAGYNGAISSMMFAPRSDTSMPSEFRTLPTNPLGCNGSNNRVKVYHPRHSLYSNAKGKSYVRLTTQGDISSDSTTNDISPYVSGYFFKVEEVKPNSYTLDLSTRYYYNSSGAFTAESTPGLGSSLTTSLKRFGKDLWYIQAAGKYDLLKLNASVLLAPLGTTVQFTKKMTYLDENGVHGESGYDQIIPGVDYVSDKQYVAFMSGELKAQANAGESDYTLTTDESEHGINFRAHISTSNKWSTPIIDLQSMSATLGKSMHSQHSTTDAVSGTTDYARILASASCIFDAAEDSVTLPISTNLITSFDVGGVLQITGTTSNNMTCQITKIDVTTRKIFVDAALTNETANATLDLGVEYVSEASSSGGTGMSKYITKEIVLADISSSIHVTAALTTPTGTSMEFWYRTGNSSLAESAWIKKEIDTTVTPDGSVFYDTVVEVNNIPEFTRFQCKFVFFSTTHYTPALKDLRIIALV